MVGVTGQLLGPGLVETEPKQQKHVSSIGLGVANSLSLMSYFKRPTECVDQCWLQCMGVWVWVYLWGVSVCLSQPICKTDKSSVVLKACYIGMRRGSVGGGL